MASRLEMIFIYLWLFFLLDLYVCLHLKNRDGGILPIVSDNVLIYFIGGKKDNLFVLLGHVQLRLSPTEEFIQMLRGERGQQHVE